MLVIKRYIIAGHLPFTPEEEALAVNIHPLIINGLFYAG